MLFYKHSSQRNITSKIKGERKHQQNRIIMGTPRPIIKRISLENLSAPVSKIILYYKNILYYKQQNHDRYCKKTELGDNCIQNFHLGRYIVRYMVGNLVLRRHTSGTIKRDIRTR